MSDGHDASLDRRAAMKAAAAVLAVQAIDGPLAAQRLAGTGLAPGEAIGLGRDQDFNDGWRFARGAHDGAHAAGFDASGWRSVDLPHDWSIEDLDGQRPPDRIGPFDRGAVGGTAVAFTVGGEGWYRRHFRLAEGLSDAHVELRFDGVHEIGEVWINGNPLRTHRHGYTPFAHDLTPHIDRGGDNVVAVHVRNQGENSRWYGGSGIYRQVRIDVLGQATRIARWGVGAWTRRADAGAAVVEVTTRVDGLRPALVLRTRLLDGNGLVVAEQRGPALTETQQTLRVSRPQLWAPDSPSLYTLESTLLVGGDVVDRVTEPFGVRVIAFSPTTGMTINGSRVMLRGGCVHHDNGLLGAAAFPDADERRVALLKARGFNAIRSSHNPSSRSFREACDRQGMLLIEEAFDMWFAPKLAQDYSGRFEADWRDAMHAMVMSARNSASVMMWSIGNEIPDRSTWRGVETQWQLADAVHRLDPTRPVTAALNGVLGPDVVAAAGTAPAGAAGRTEQASAVFLDVVGYNYRLEDVEADQRLFPHRIVYASETFPREVFDYADLSGRAPYFLGEFVWTALDYLGEAGIGAAVPVRADTPFYLPQWPWAAAACGDIDLIGNQRAQSLARDVAWGISPLEMAVQRPVADGQREYLSNWAWSDELPSWTWPEAGGRMLAVRAYTSGDRVRLSLNGRVVGEQTLSPSDKMTARFTVAYAPGTLEAVAFRGEREIGRKRFTTLGPPAQLSLTAEKSHIGSDRRSLGHVGIAVLDAAGRVLPDAAVEVALAVDGPVALAAFGSGNPMAVGSVQSPRARTFRGRALAILRATGQAGTARIRATSPGLAMASTSIRLG